MSERNPRWEFELEQGGMVVVSGEAPTRALADREAGHYAVMYSSEGPVKVRVFQKKPKP